MTRLPLLDRPAICRDNNRIGFTLMEVLLVTILSAVLMVGLWSLFGTYIRLFESGPARTERAQLLRALKQQFSDDLRGAIQISESPAESTAQSTFAAVSAPAESFGDGTTAAATAPLIISSSEASPLPRYGIVGTSQSLAIVTLQVPTESFALPAADDAPVDFSETTSGLAPELKTVLYTFTESRERTPLDHEPPPGLIRRELDWQTVLSDQTFADPSEFGNAQTPAAEETEELIADESTTWVPEVIDLQIRYFGDGRWQSSWDSLQRRALPSAVEVVIEFEDTDDRDAGEDDESDTVADFEESDSSDVDEVVLDNEVGSTFTTAAESHKPRHRFLIHLPCGAVGTPPSSFGLPATDSSMFTGGAP